MNTSIDKKLEKKIKFNKELSERFFKDLTIYQQLKTMYECFNLFNEKNPDFSVKYGKFRVFFAENNIKEKYLKQPITKKMNSNSSIPLGLTNSKLKKLQQIKNKELMNSSNGSVVAEGIEEVLTEKKEFVVNIYDPKNEIIDETSFTPLKTNKGIDEIISDEKGVMPGTTTVIVGPPGTGKTTLTLSLLNDIQINNDDSECMSLTSEMKKIDIDAEIIKKPWMRNVKQIILSQHNKEDYPLVLKEVILYGYDFLVIDSFQNIVERLKTFNNMSGTEASSFLMDLFEKANEGKTKTGKKTAIFLIQQVTKSGEFAGKNSLKHDTTAMLELVYDRETNSRYCFYSKNRRCGENQFKKLYYYMDPETKEINFDMERFEGERIQEKAIEREKEIIAENKKVFDEILKKGEKTLFNFLNKEPVEGEDGEVNVTEDVNEHSESITEENNDNYEEELEQEGLESFDDDDEIVDLEGELQI